MKEQNRKRAAVALGGATLALLLLFASRRGGAGGDGSDDGGGDARLLPVPPEVLVWLRDGDRIELDGARVDLETAIVRAQQVGRARINATGGARVGWIGTVINALRAAQVVVLAEPSLFVQADYVRALTEATSLGPSQELRNAARRRSAHSKGHTDATSNQDVIEHPHEPPYAWQRGLDMEESRRIAASINQAARDEEARREAARLHAKPPELRATVSVEGTRVLVDTEANTGAANEAWRALRAANLYICDTEGPRIIVVGRDRGNHAQALASTIEALRAAGFVVEVNSTGSIQELRNAAARRRASLPRYDERRGLWHGGDSRTLYAFTSLLNGRTWVVPGKAQMYWGPDATVRVATREEAEELWQRPLHPGWTVVESPRNATSEPTHIAILRRMHNELFATKSRAGDLLSTSASVRGAIDGAPPKGDVYVRGEYTSDGSHWGIGRGRIVATRENGRWILG